MAQRTDRTVAEYLTELEPNRRQLVTEVRKVILDNLQPGHEETMQYGVSGYVVPLERHPKTYNKQPLAFVSLASQENCVSLYLMDVYGDKETEHWFTDRFKASGKELSSGKSCVRFKRLDALPMDLIGEAIAKKQRWPNSSGYTRRRGGYHEGATVSALRHAQSERRGHGQYRVPSARAELVEAHKFLFQHPARPWRHRIPGLYGLPLTHHDGRQSARDVKSSQAARLSKLCRPGMKNRNGANRMTRPSDPVGTCQSNQPSKLVPG